MPERLVLNGTLTLRNAEALQSRLREALVPGLPLDIDCADAEEVDLSFVQLLLAARRSAVEAGTPLRLVRPIAAPLRDVLRRGGLVATTGVEPSAETLWLEGETAA